MATLLVTHIGKGWGIITAGERSYRFDVTRGELVCSRSERRWEGQTSIDIALATVRAHLVGRPSSAPPPRAVRRLFDGTPVGSLHCASCMCTSCQA